jgi:hypothetical protein
MTDQWLHGFNDNVEEWDADGLHDESRASGALLSERVAEGIAK